MPRQTRQTSERTRRGLYPRGVALAVLLVLHFGALVSVVAQETSAPHVFDLPGIHQRYVAGQAVVAELFRRDRHADAERACAELTRLVPHDPVAHYNLACAQSLQGRVDEAIDNLAKAVELGFADVKLMRSDDDLAAVRDAKADRFAELVAAAGRDDNKPRVDPWRHDVTVAPIVDGVATVAAANTAYDARVIGFRPLFRLSPLDADAAKQPPIKGFGDVGKLVNQWYAEGSAAGNHGDLYDNHDGDHSNMRYQTFPQLTRIEFDDEVRKRRLHTGVQNRFLYTIIPDDPAAAPRDPHAFGCVIGNSSTALTRGPMWRSQTRLAYTDPRSAALLYAQYVANHLYLYPEHRDHDPGRNGEGGHGDVYPANTPYVITSQGSSGSDRVFLDALAATLAVLRPDVKRRLIAEHALMPTLQMIFRRANKQVRNTDDYLSGAAHPTVFDGKQIDATRMVMLAHAIEPGAEPPVVQLAVTDEELGTPGVDYFAAPGRNEKLFDTPAAIARIGRSLKHERRIVIDASASRDLNGRDLTFEWKLLRGDPQRVTIRKLDDAGTRAEIIVAHHERRPIAPGSDMHSPRVDIGVFAHNGVHHSAPAFVTFYFPDNERRVYDNGGRLVSVEYTDDYVDPLIAMPRHWTDVYAYDGDTGKLTGWTRTHRDGRTELFDAEGRLMTDDGPVAVRYAAQPRDGKAPLLVAQPVSGG